MPFVEIKNLFEASTRTLLHLTPAEGFWVSFNKIWRARGGQAEETLDYVIERLRKKPNLSEMMNETPIWTARTLFKTELLLTITRSIHAEII